MTLGFNIWTTLRVFAGLFFLLFFVAMVWAVIQWWGLCRRGARLPFLAYLRLRWRGVPVAPVAAANWVAVHLGYEIPLNVWVSFSLLRVDIVKVAAALAAADKCNIKTGIGPLGAAALAGYDPLDVVRATQERGLKSFTSDELNEIGQWGLDKSENQT